MFKITIGEIEPNREIAGTFAVKDVQPRVARNGKPFLTLRLADKSGEITARLWDGVDEAAAVVRSGGVVAVRASSETFRDEVQLQIREIRPVPIEEVNPEDFLPACPADLPALYQRLKKHLGTIRRKTVANAVHAVIGDAALMRRFRRAPAAKSMHHAYIGGLMEHTVAVMAMVARIADQYPELDRDLLVAGAFLHDIGKVDEFQYTVTIDYSDQGRLLGHMVLGVQILDERVRSLGAPPGEDLTMLRHLILSHHGEPRFDAARLPMTREALVLHFADDLDAKMNAVGGILRETAASGNRWSRYQPLFERFFYRGDACPEASPERPEENDPEKGVQLCCFPGVGKGIPGGKE